jgi:hypothetical protein
MATASALPDKLYEFNLLQLAARFLERRQRHIKALGHSVGDREVLTSPVMCLPQLRVEA